MKFKNTVSVLILIFLPLLAYAEITNDDWKKAIQYRMDYSNPSNNRAICYIYPYGDNEPYMRINQRNDSLVDSSSSALFNESVWIRKSIYRVNEVFYQYDVSEYGKKYQVRWPKIKEKLGFCFGNLTVLSIIDVNDLTVTYQYKIDVVPEWANVLLSKHFDSPLNQLQTAKAKFAYNDDQELISLSNNFSYYINADVSASDHYLVAKELKK